MPAILIETGIDTLPSLGPMVRVTVGDGPPVYTSSPDGYRWVSNTPEDETGIYPTQCAAVCAALGVERLPNWTPGRAAGLLVIGRQYNPQALPPFLGWTADPGLLTVADFFYFDGTYLGPRVPTRSGWTEPVFAVEE